MLCTCAACVAFEKPPSPLATMNDIDPSVFEQLAGGMMRNLATTVSEETRVRRFRAFFGTTPIICSMLWSLCVTSFIAQRVMPVHLLWALLFLKQYNTEEVNATITGTDEKTFRKWSWLVISILADLDGVVSKNE